MLKIVLDFDVLEAQGTPQAAAVDTMRARRGLYDPEILETFAALTGHSVQQMVIEEMPVAALRTGLTFADDVRTRDGGLLIARGHEITQGLLDRIRTFNRNVGIREPLKILVAVASPSEPPSRR